MLARFENCRALNSGAYLIDSRSYRWIDFYDPDARETVIRYTVAEAVPEFSVAFGDSLDLTCEVVNETRVVKGTDRTAVRHKVVIHDLRPSKSTGAGRADKAAALESAA